MCNTTCDTNYFFIEDYCDKCRYYDDELGCYLGGCSKSGHIFGGMTNFYKCEDFKDAIADSN